MRADDGAPRRDRRHPTPWRRVARAAGFAVVFSVPVAALALVVHTQSSPVVIFDQSAIRTATDATRANPGLHRALIIWQELLQGRWVNLAGTGLCLWVWRRRGLGTRALWAFVTLMVSWGLATVVKMLVGRARPVVEHAVSHAGGYSFPSGHAANTAAAGMTLTLLMWPLLGARARIGVPVAVSVVVVLTALDRVFLGVHYPSDVVGGVAFGTALAGASYLGYLGWNPSPEPSDDEPEEPQ